MVCEHSLAPSSNSTCRRIISGEDNARRGSKFPRGRKDLNLKQATVGHATTVAAERDCGRRRLTRFLDLDSSLLRRGILRLLDAAARLVLPPFPETPLFFWQRSWFLVLILLMALPFSALAFFLYLALEFPAGSPGPTVVTAEENVQITYGSVIKLMHERTKFRLHSHDVPYGSGSGQQSVTGFPNVDDSNSYWIVKSPPESSAKQGDVIPNGTILRLQHMRTRKWLHSHLHASPITGNLEVSCFGGEEQSDTGDFWRLEIEGNGKTWKQDQRIRLRHIDTSGYLHSHDKKYTRIAGGQQEICGISEKRPDNVWLAAEGVYLPVNTSK